MYPLCISKMSLDSIRSLYVKLSNIKKQNIFSEDAFDPSDKSHRIIKVGRDLRKCLVQPPAQSWASYEIRPVCLGIDPLAL